MYLLWFHNNSRSKLRSPNSDIDPCSPLWAVETLWSHSNRHLPLMPFCSLLLSLFLLLLSWQKTMWTELVTKWPHLKCEDKSSWKTKCVCARERERDMGGEREWEIPFSLEGLAGSGVCVREIIFSVYGSVVSPLSHTPAAPLSISLFFSISSPHWQYKYFKASLFTSTIQSVCIVLLCFHEAVRFTHTAPNFSIDTHKRLNVLCIHLFSQWLFSL